jgi:hypothetical protein
MFGRFSINSQLSLHMFTANIVFIHQLFIRIQRLNILSIMNKINTYTIGQGIIQNNRKCFFQIDGLSTSTSMIQHTFCKRFKNSASAECLFSDSFAILTVFCCKSANTSCNNPSTVVNRTPNVPRVSSKSNSGTKTVQESA